MVIAFACNDERGNFTGLATGINLPAGLLSLTSQHLRGVRFITRDCGVRVSRRWFPSRGCVEGYGNVFWNGYDVPVRDVVRLLVYLKESGKWMSEGGIVEIGQWWDRDTGYSEADWLIAQFRDVLKAQSVGAVIVGNSSTSVRECAYLGTPAVVIGSRQAGRQRGPNVLECGAQRADYNGHSAANRAREIPLIHAVRVRG